MNLWNKDTEKEFFLKGMEFATPEQLFYVSNDSKYYAYWAKAYKGIKTTLQSRNSLIGKFTEKWCTDLIQPYAKKINAYAIQGAICEEIGLPSNSSADVAICKKNSINQNPEDILMIFEVKMSIVWNWNLMFDGKNNILECIGDYNSHQGNPSLLRSDSMLKAIGKSINLRISEYKSSHIPIIVLGNTPITKNYYKKVDKLKTNGIIQGFWSLNPNITENNCNIKSTPQDGFLRIDSYEEFESKLDELSSERRTFFSAMKTNNELGFIIEKANQGQSYEEKAELFLTLIRNKEN